MGARLWTALLALAAVFAMHGLQCAATDGSGSTATTSVSDRAHLGAVDVTPPSPVHTAETFAAGVADDPMPGHDGVPHDTTAHLWTLCLAVLAVAVAAMLAWLVPRMRQLTAPVLGHARVRLRALPPPRPPDLSALCLLRI